MEKQLLAQALSKLRFCATLPDDVLARLASFASLHTYPAGSLLFREGDHNNDLLIVSTGRIELDIDVPPRSGSRILSLGSGELVAWSSVLGDGRMTTSAVTLEDTQIVAISADEVQSACAVNRDFGYFFMRQLACALAERLQATRLKLSEAAVD
jgi:CRP-like cAMP-binding protein